MKKKNVLFLVHVEESFRKHFPDAMFPLRLIKACQAQKYDEVHILVSHVMDDEPIFELNGVTNSSQWIDWGWGYEPLSFDQEEKEWCISSYAHEWTWIPPELRNDAFQNCNIFVGGGCESECLEDFVSILDYLNYDYEKIRGYIY